MIIKSALIWKKMKIWVKSDKLSKWNDVDKLWHMHEENVVGFTIMWSIFRFQIRRNRLSYWLCTTSMLEK